MTLRPARSAAALLALALLATAAPARAQFWKGRHLPEGGPPPGVQPVQLDQVGVDEKLDAALPLDTPLTDWRGKPYTLRQAFDGRRPVILALVYFDCPMLCGLILSGLSKAMRENGLELGKDYQAVTISFDPADRPAMAAERRRGYLQAMGRADGASEDWPFLVGTAQATQGIADALGFHYRKDEVSGEWAHMATIFVLTPEGHVSRYLYGIEFPPKDLRLSLVEAAGGRVGTSFDRFLLTCYRYDPAVRKYQPYAFGIVRTGALLTLAALATLVGTLFRRERRRARGGGSLPRPSRQQA